MFRGIYRVFTGKSECGDFKITGIAGIHAIPIVFHCIYSFYGIKVYKKSIFLTTYPSPLVNVVCERPLGKKICDDPTASTIEPRRAPALSHILFAIKIIFKAV